MACVLPDAIAPGLRVLFTGTGVGSAFAPPGRSLPPLARPLLLLWPTKPCERFGDSSLAGVWPGDLISLLERQ